MNDLLRELAPISSAAWKAIDDEARRYLVVRLAARRIVDFSGPLGWDTSATGLGRVERLSRGPDAGVEARLRRVQPLVELRVPFELDREEMEAIGRGAKDGDFAPLHDAARKIAMAEDKAVFHGYGVAGIDGIAQVSSGAALTIPSKYIDYPSAVAEAVSRLRRSGVTGPYAIALGPRCYTGLTQTMTPSGHLVLHFVEQLVGGPAVWAPSVDGAVVVSMRGGDFELIVGQDISIGYTSHSASAVQLYLQESFTFRAIGAEAAVPLVYAKSGGGRGRK
jgi:uncharacterized linocin/CFP29 family protein